jgi:hypothetical protein
MRAALLMLAVLLLAGCATRPTPVAAPTPTVTAAPWSFGAGGVALEKCKYQDCYEPTIAADPQGRLFVADGITSAVAVSSDAGKTWTQRDPPPLPMGLAGDQSDVIVQVAPSGRLYYSALVVVYPPVGVGAVLEGIEVAWSDDGAATWAGNVHVSPATATPQVVSPDRQWLGFAPDGTIYLTYNQIPTGIWLAKSGDQGKTWTGWTRAASVEGRNAGIGQSGPPVVDGAGRVYVPACQGGATTTDVQGGTLVFRSDDQGKTFTRSVVVAQCNWFPILTVAKDGTLVLALQPDGVTVSSSTDQGKTFTTTKAWGSPKASAAAWPVALPDGGVDVAWFDVGGTTAELHVSRGTVAGMTQDVAVGTVSAKSSSGNPTRTDYASAALLPDGRLAVVWVKGNQAMVAVEAP